MKLWHPHTERPDCVCSCLIAVPPDHADDPFALAGSYYSYNPRDGLFRGEENDAPLMLKEFFWAKERDLLAELEASR